jgi:Reverse transcriptase (RNA-dependent DNA polymerase)/Type II intron maturase
LDHEIMIKILAEKIRDNRFLRLMRNMLRAGYLEDWRWNATLSGCPQGGMVSPILSNIYLHKLDDFAGNILVPEYTRGETRTRNSEYERVRHAYRRARKSGNHEKARELRRRQVFLPSVDCDDPGYRRLHYARYADDTLFGFTGPKAEAEEIKQRLTTFLRDELRLELSAEKTLITHARTGAAKFLGYEITTQHSGTSGRKRINGSIALRVPAVVIKAKCAPYLERGKPAAQRALQNLGDYDIVAAYGAKYRGVSQYYLLAGDVHKLSRLRWVMVTSLLKTLAAKHDSTVSKMAARYKATIETPHGPRTCFEAVRIREGNQKPLVARFGGIPLKRRKTAVITDRAPGRDSYPRKEIITRLQRNRCELCQHSGQVQVHHVARLADLAYPGHGQPAWARLMAAKRRKSLVVCPPCHDQIHAERPPAAISATA